MPLRLRAAPLAALATLAACDNDVAAPGPQPGFVKVVHAVANAGPVTVLADTAPLAGPVAVGAVGPTANFQYFGLPAGARRVQVVPVGGSAAVIAEELTLAPGTYTTLVAAGTVGGAGALAPAFVVLSDSVTTDAATAPAAGRIRLRVVHAATRLGAVDVHAQLVGTGSPRNFSAATRVFANVAFRGAGAAQVPATAAGVNYDLCVIAAGTTPAANGSNCAILATLPTPSTANGLADAQQRRARSVVTLIARDPIGTATAPGLIVTTDKPVQP